MSDISPVKPRPWWATLRVYLEPASLRMLTLGFSSGLPLLLVLGTLSFRLREAGIDRATIGHLSWVGLAYGFKWVWAPLVDRLPIPLLTRWLGRRRSWLLLAQCGVMAGLVGMAAANPSDGLDMMTWCALAVAFASATQDIALDAYRIESAPTDVQPALAASYQTGYRIAMIWAGAGVLWIAARSQGALSGYDDSAWHAAYLVMSVSMLVGMFTVLFAREPQPQPLAPIRSAKAWLRTALVEPFTEFLRRYRWQAALILALIAIYRISDIVMGIMANPFYVDMGYTKDEIAFVTKIFGLIMTLVGAFIGGSLSIRLGVMRVLMMGAVLSAGSNVAFSWLAGLGHNLPALTLVVSADNLSSGLASAAFIGYLSGLTNVSYSATQYALFSSLMLLLPKFIAGFSGNYVNAFGYANFFTSTALLGLPVVVLVLLAMRAERKKASGP